MNNKQALAVLDSLSIAIISLTVFLFPLFFLTNTTDPITIPKQLLVIFAGLLVLVLLGIKILIERRLVLNVNPLSAPLLIFAVIVTISSVLSRNRLDSLIQTVPLLFAIVFFFLIVNSVKERKSFSILLASITLGAAASAILTTLTYFKIYVFPFEATRNQFFNTFGSQVQQLLYLIPIATLSLFYIARKLGFPKVKFSSSLFNSYEFFIQFFSFFTILVGIIVILYTILFSPNKPILLPYIYGFQTAAATITQDAQRFVLSLLFGSGYGTFATDFTRFKLPSFNLEQNIWNLTFSFSSTYFLELIATIGLLGAISYLGVVFSVIKIRDIKNPIFAGVLAVFILSFILPFNFAVITLLMMLAGIYIAYLNIAQSKQVYDAAMSLVATKSGGLSLETFPEEHHSRNQSPIFSGVVFLLIILFVGFFGFFAVRFASAEFKFAQSLRQISLNNGQRVYELQTQALRDFPYNASYHRVFSQINLALANSLAQGIEAGSSPSANIQRNITVLLQQSINSGRNAVILSPLTSLNWQNLSQIYRSLINVGQNAEQFAIASMSQAIALDPFNPILRIQLGGIYYQLRSWDNAQQQFQIAINLKRDFANAYYNFGHVLEEKGDLEGALSAYQTVRQLSQGNKENLDKISGEIAGLEARIGKSVPGQEISSKTEQTPLQISTPSAQLPPQEPPIKISPPPKQDEEATESAK